jgi:hypothetical protein
LKHCSYADPANPILLGLESWNVAQGIEFLNPKLLSPRLHKFVDLEEMLVLIDELIFKLQAIYKFFHF